MMKRQTIKFVGAALLGVAVFASCQDYTPDEQAIIKRKTVADYEKAFYAEFPNIDPEQNWGFGPMPICGEDVDITRGMNTNSNEWVSVYHYEVPGGLSDDGSAPWGWVAGDISNYERAYVYWWFSTHQWPEPLLLKWNDLFIQQVWGQPEHSGITGGNVAPQYKGEIRNGTDLLTILDIDRDPINPPYTLEPSYAPTINSEASALTHWLANKPEGYEDVSDFNSGGNMQEAVMYAFDVSTEDFWYRDSYGIGNNYHNNWTVRYINGNYYLGFDYWTAKKNGNGYNDNEVYGYVKPDGYYNDWIIKLSNGTHLVSSYTRRIMCEDLGDTFDWDFNDLVFDVTIYNGQYGNGQSGYYAQIMLQAAGGTLPIYIGEKKPEYEAHFLFGVPTTTPVNVDAVGGVKRPAVEFNLPIPQAWVVESTNQYGKVYSIDFEKIPIIVDRSGSGMSNKESALVLTAEKGKAPQKFACPSDTYWMKEFQNIEGIENKQIAGHPNFAAWVAGTVAGNTPEEKEYNAFITERSKNEYPSTHFNVLYADANGMPYSVSWWSTDDDSDQIRPWRELWMEKPDDEQFTAPRSVPKYVKSDGTANIDRDGYTTYSTTFQAQAPFIYETRGADDDPTAYSPHKMEAIIPRYANQEVAWSPEAKKVELEVNDQGKGYVLGSGYYHKGASFDITAVPRPGQLFSKWVEGPGERFISDQSTFHIANLDRDLKYKAIFEEDPNAPNYHVYFASDPVGAGYIQNHPGSDLGEYKVGSKAQFVAMSNRGYLFSHWEDGNIYETRELTITGETTITATYDVLTAYNITVRANNDTYGDVSIRKADWSVQGNGVYYEYEMLVIEATGKNGHQFVGWTNSANTDWDPHGGSSITIYPEDEFGYEPPSEIILTAIFQ